MRVPFRSVKNICKASRKPSTWLPLENSHSQICLPEHLNAIFRNLQTFWKNKHSSYWRFIAKFRAEFWAHPEMFQSCYLAKINSHYTNLIAIRAYGLYTNDYVSKILISPSQNYKPPGGSDPGNVKRAVNRQSGTAQWTPRARNIPRTLGSYF